MNNAKIQTAVFVSGGGTNLQAILDAEADGRIVSSEVSVVISDNAEAYALTRAAAAGRPTAVIGKQNFEEDAAAVIENHGCELIVLAGFMRILSPEFTNRYRMRIINVHPSLIPSFCGKGFYGIKVHEAALAYGVKVTGATVHYVNEIPDGGRIIMQKAVEIKEGDTPETLQKRVMQEAEWEILPASVEKVAREMLERRKGQ